MQTLFNKYFPCRLPCIKFAWTLDYCWLHLCYNCYNPDPWSTDVYSYMGRNHTFRWMDLKADYTWISMDDVGKSIRAEVAFFSLGNSPLIEKSRRRLRQRCHCHRFLLSHPGGSLLLQWVDDLPNLPFLVACLEQPSWGFNLNFPSCPLQSSPKIPKGVAKSPWKMRSQLRT